MRLQQDSNFTTLSWVKPELDETLRQARQALEAHVENGGERSQMQVCATQLHQVQGTLRMVELYGAAMVAEEMEQLANALLGTSVAHRDEAYGALMRSIMQLPDYLERLQSGHRDIPMVLLPLLNDLRGARGEKGVPESVLFSVDLGRPLPASAGAVPAALHGDLLRATLEPLRVSFQSALLPWLRDEEQPDNVTVLADVCSRLVAIASVEPARKLFWVAAGILDALRSGAFVASKPLKQAVAKIEREIKRIADEGEAAFAASPPADLTRQLLYYASSAPTENARIVAIREAFGLSREQHDESELAHARGSLTGHNRELLDTVSAGIKEDLLRVKEALDMHLRTTGAPVAELASQGDALGAIADTLGMLGLGVPRKVVQDQRTAIQALASGQRAADENALLEIAGSLLYVEASLDDQVARLGQPVDEQAAEGMPMPLRESQQALDALIKESVANFVQARQCFVAFIEAGWDHAQLHDVPRLLDEVSGAMHLLEQLRAARQLHALSVFTQIELVKLQRVPDAGQMDRLADALASLEYYLEALRDHRPQRDRILELAEHGLVALGYWPVPAAAEQALAEAARPAAKPVETPKPAEAPKPAEVAPVVVAVSPEPAPIETAPVDVAQPVEKAAPTMESVEPVAVAETPAPPAPPVAPVEAAPVVQQVAAPAPPAVPGRNYGFADSAEIDDDIREVFIEELDEESGNLNQLFAEWSARPAETDVLRPLRRVFHTLKGSGRLVGALELGEFSWKIESMLNRVLDGSRPASPAVVALVGQAAETLPQFRAALMGTNGAVTADIETLKVYADRVAGGEDVFYVPTAAAPAVVEAAVVEPAIVEPAVVEAVAEVAPEPVVAVEPIAEPVEATKPPEVPAAVEEDVPEGSAFAVVDPVLLEILRAEVEAHLQTIQQWSAASATSLLPVSDALLRAIHTISGAFAMTEVPLITDALSPTEGYIRRLLVHHEMPSVEGTALIRDVARAIDGVLAALLTTRPLIPPQEELAERAIALRDALPLPAPLGETEEEVQAERIAAEQAEAERVAAEQAEVERVAAEQAEVERVAAEQAEAERVAAERAEAERVAAEQAEAERVAAEQAEAERVAAEQAEAERVAAEQAEAERVAAEQAEAERVAAERAEVERLAAQKAEEERLEYERLEAEYAEAERLAAEHAEAERLAAEQAEAARIAAEHAEAERIAAEQAEAAHRAMEQAEADRIAAAETEAERQAAEQAKAERIAAEQAEAERIAAERAEAERLAAEQAEAERIAAEQAEAERLELERLEAEYAEAERVAAELAEAERMAAEQAEAERLAAEREVERVAAEQAEAERLAIELAEAERVAAEHAEAARVAADAAEAERIAAEEEAVRLAAESAEAERIAADLAEAERVAMEQAKAERLAAEHAESERLEFERLAAELAEAERAEAERAETEALGAEVAQAAQEAVFERSTAAVADERPATKEASSSQPVFMFPADADADPDEPLDLSDVDPELLDIFVEETTDILDHSDGLLARLREAPTEREMVVGLQRDLHTLKGGARMCGMMSMGELAHAMESVLEGAAESRLELGPQGLGILEQGFDRLHGMLSRIQAHQAVALPEHMISVFNLLAHGEIAAIMAAASPAPATADSTSDAVAAGEEAAVSFDDTAKLAESAVPSEQAGAEAADVAESAQPARGRPGLKPLSVPVESAFDTEDDIGVRAPQEQVRIRADLLDRLVNYAGEVAIYRARLEQQLGTFRTHLDELEQTTTRLRQQLRKLEIETEAQISARYQRAGEGEESFDPLELDRFSTQQQLTRALAESAADMTSLHVSLDDVTRQYETLLLQQSRVSSELQDGLMRTRMVPFDALVPRLRRVIRQTATETGKQIQIKVEGAQGEMDRNVLDRMTAPLEHMLRNSAVHGLETAEVRRAAGKPEEGTVTVSMHREGSEVVMLVSDDGRGLDREAIRRKAIERGLLKPDVEVSDSALYAFILESGFSTAESVSRLAGRGVGMDVVHNEIRQLGGSLQLSSTVGKGTQFTIRLPFTLAVTQAALVKIGEISFAVPISSVQGVGRIARDELEKQLGSAKPVYMYAGEEYAIHDLGRLLGGASAKAPTSLQMPLLLSRSGDIRAAICVDEVLGSREIVVKPVGPQVSSIPGIFGATIMGDGGVMVILDVVPLVRRAAAQALEPVAPVVEAAPEVRRIPLVMVVDDSITMRKVTGRVLERNNMEVLAAKDGVDAIEKMADVIPDLMLLDIEMPRMDGYELATHMRNDVRLRDVPIVMITSRTGEKHRQRAFEIGVNRYLGKPYQEAELMRNVFELLAPVHNDG